ncbi:hypothetical protein ACVFI8_09220 [Agarivorans sp. MS3-6]
MQPKLNLVVGRESTWSIRAYLCLQLAKLDFDITTIALGDAGYQQQLRAESATMLVPVLHTKEVSVHDSLAITEFANELCNGGLYPASASKRAIARSYLAELHSGFSLIRSQLPFQLLQTPDTASTIPLQSEIARLTCIWQPFGPSFAFGHAGAVDAFYSLMALRLLQYGVTLDGNAGRYQQHLVNWPLFQQALLEAKKW